MKLIKWAEQVQDRLTWKDIVEKAKTTRVVVQKKKKFTTCVLTAPQIVTRLKRSESARGNCTVSDNHWLWRDGCQRHATESSYVEVMLRCVALLFVAPQTRSCKRTLTSVNPDGV